MAPLERLEVLSKQLIGELSATGASQSRKALKQKSLDGKNLF
jgi:hypothetical protein